MTENHIRIPTEIVQKFSSAQAWKYLLMPYRYKGETLECYGVEDNDYAGVCQELEILYGEKVSVIPADKQWLQELLHKYYREDKTVGKQAMPAVSGITSGRSFLLSLIEEAFDMKASDIHVEA